MDSARFASDSGRHMTRNSAKGTDYSGYLNAELEGFSLAADVAAGTGRAPTPPRKIAPPSSAKKDRPSTPPRQSLIARDRPSTPPRQSLIGRERASTPPRQFPVSRERSSTPPRQIPAGRKERSLTPPKKQRSGTPPRSSTPPRLSASQRQSVTNTFTTALAAASGPCDRRFSWRENVAQNKHSARVAQLRRSTSEGSLRNGIASRGAKTPPKGRGQRESMQNSIVGLERIGASSSTSIVPNMFAEARTASSPSRSNCTNASPVKAVDGKDLYQQVSSLVEELEAARSRAAVSGGRPPKALEAAASALEPLLRLRDVTGAFACDLTLMPWLPQLLAVFRNVLHTAVDGPGAPPRTPPACDSHLASADLGAGGFAVPALTQGVRGGDEFLGLAGLAQASVLLELEALRAHKRQQDQTLRDSQQRERELQEEVEALKSKQRELLEQVNDAENRAAAAREATRKAEAIARDAALDAVAAVEMVSPRDPTLPADALARRVAGLERESCRWECEKRSVEVRLAELAGLVSAAVEKDVETRPRTQSLSSPSRTSVSSPRRTSAAALKQRYIEQMARVYAGRNESDVSGGM